MPKVSLFIDDMTQTCAFQSIRVERIHLFWYDREIKWIIFFLKSSACLLKKQIIINIQDKTSRYIEAVLVELMTYN